MAWHRESASQSVGMRAERQQGQSESRTEHESGQSWCCFSVKLNQNKVLLHVSEAFDHILWPSSVDEVSQLLDIKTFFCRSLRSLTDFSVGLINNKRI